MMQVSTIFNPLHAGRGLMRAALIASMSCVAPAFAQADSAASSSLVQRYSGRIGSADVAERALAEVTKERSGIDKRFAAEQHACFDDFFANSCVDKAKERRRQALEELRKVEVEANAFLRQTRANEKDMALEEKRVERERKEVERLQELAAEPPKKPKVPTSDTARPAAVPKQDAADPRVARHQAKMKQLEEHERAQEQKRAEKVANYERKVKRAEERQRQVEERKKKKEEERAGPSSAK
jgi:colicin import membrane protein